MKKLFILHAILFSCVFVFSQKKKNNSVMEYSNNKYLESPRLKTIHNPQLMAFMQLPEVKIFRDSTVVEVEDSAIIQSENADIPAKFNGTGKDLKKIFLRNHMGYTSDEIDEDIKTNTVATFIIEKDGTVTEVKLLQSISEELDRKLLWVFRRLPKFCPAKHNGKWVRCKVVVPIRIDVEMRKKREIFNGKSDIKKSDLK